MPADKPLSDYRFLVVDDEPLIVMYMEDVLEDLGATVKTKAYRLDQALAAVADGPYDCATLDINLSGGSMSYPVAEALSQAQIPFVFCSSYPDVSIVKNYKAPVLIKPVRPEELTAAVLTLLKKA